MAVGRRPPPPSVSEPAPRPAQALAAAQPGPAQAAQAGGRPAQAQPYAGMYDASGIPQTPEAWAMQDQIDGGKLHAMYTKMAQGGKPPADPALIDAYLGAARKEGDRAAFMAEFMPTDTDNMGTALKNIGSGDKRGLQTSPFVAGTRAADVELANMYKKAHPDQDMYGLVMPYSNTVENIYQSGGRPKDGAQALARDMAKVGPQVNSMAVGYSQGGGAVLEYEREYGASQGLHYGVAVAPMGGADQQGADGVWAGKNHGVPTLSIAHKLDPAMGIHTRPGATGPDAWLAQGMAGFETSPNHFLHSQPIGGDSAKGTAGYPMDRMRPIGEQFFAGQGQFGGQGAYQKQAEWDFVPPGADAKIPGNDAGSVRTLGGQALGLGKDLAQQGAQAVQQGAQAAKSGVQQGVQAADQGIHQAKDWLGQEAGRIFGHFGK